MKLISKFFSFFALILLALAFGLQNVQPALAIAPDQAIAVNTHAPGNAAYGESFTVAASADSGLDVAYSALGACTHVGATFTMTSGTGDCTVQYDQAGDGTYNPAAQITEAVVAQPAAITVTADAKSKTYGVADPALTYTITSGALVGADAFAGALARASGEAVGAYAITQDTLALSGNYALTYVGANLTITAELTATPTATSIEPLATATLTATITAAPATITLTRTSTDVPATATPTRTTAPATITRTATATPTKTATRTITHTPTAPAFYVSPAGHDSNTCNSVAAPCQTINGALGKAAAGDTIKVAVGTYTNNVETNGIVVTINKNITLLGGWDASFTTQNGISVIDGQGTREGFTVNSGAIAIIERFAAQNGYIGIYNAGNLTLNNSSVSGNTSGGLYNYGGILTLNNDTVSGNTTVFNGGGIANWGTLTLKNTTVSNNTAISLYSPYGGGGIYNGSNDSTVMLINSLLAGNIDNRGGPDCGGAAISSGGYNLIGNTSGCSFSSNTGDLINIDPKLGPFNANLGIYPLDVDSPAISAGNPAAPGSGGKACFSIDQRGVARDSQCDIGAFEYAIPGAPASIVAYSGSLQRAAPLTVFPEPLKAIVLDRVGNLVSGVTVTFTAPASGASGTFADSGTNTTTAVTNANGIATAANFMSNTAIGSYAISTGTTGVGAHATFILINFSAWYVATTGNNNNDCASPITPCATINAAIGKAINGDHILIAAGIYTDSGSEVVSLSKNVTLSGGWNTGFTTQSNMSIIDGQSVRQGLTVSSNTTVTIERIAAQNSNTGIYNSGDLTLNNSLVSGNRSANGGGGIATDGTLTLNNSTITGNTSSDGGGIVGVGGGTITIRNSTISGNTAVRGGGIYSGSGTTILANSIVAGNTATTSPDCSGVIISHGYNLIGNTSGCTFTPITGDLSNRDPKLGAFTGNALGYYPLQAGSPAIDAGNPAAPGSGGNACRATDQRGVIRPVGSRCDIGAYEYTIPGSAVNLVIVEGTAQHVGPNMTFSKPLKVVVLDHQGSPVSGVKVRFAAPVSGASGIFADAGTNVTAAITDPGGIATAAAFTANRNQGNYIVSATVKGVATSAAFSLANQGWFVAITGKNANSCASVTAPCLTINAALAKAAAGDTIMVAAGTYLGTGDSVVSITKSITLSGGWNASFTAQSGASTIDGQKARTGIDLTSDTFMPVIVDRFTIQNGYSGGAGGINNMGATLTLNNSIVRNNISANAGGGIVNYGTLTINNTVITKNSAGDTCCIGSLGGGGIYNGSNGGFTVILNNSVVSMSTGPGIVNDSNLTLNDSTVNGNNVGIGIGGGITTLNNSTISGNTKAGITQSMGNIIINNSTISGNTFGIRNQEPGYGSKAILQNSILMGNTYDCQGVIISSGYNLLGKPSGCSFTAATGDLINVDARLGQMIGSPGYVPLLLGSPAINAGNPATCLATDQRGLARPQDGRCDMGSYEYKTPGLAASIGYIAGSNQRGEAGGDYSVKFVVYVVDSVGSPVTNAVVKFTAPSSGSSGTFSDTHTYTTTAITNGNGVAVAATFTANNTPGSYNVNATVTGLSGLVTFALTNLPVPAALSPTDKISVVKPTYLWGKVIGATQYQYELWKDTTLVYTQTVSAGICGNTTCSHTPTNVLTLSLYKWRAMAMVGGVWQGFSVYRPFEIVIKTGLWNGPGVKFYVKPTGAFVAKFAIRIYVNGCGYYTITHIQSVPITNKHFSFGGTFYAAGTFIDPTHISGKFRLNYFKIPGCGYVKGGPFSWKATWKNLSQPAAIMDAEVIPFLAEPQVEVFPTYYTVERVAP